MPAPAVIPALLAYIEVDAVKKLVVGVVRTWEKMVWSAKVLHATTPIHLGNACAWVRPGITASHRSL